MSCSRSRRDLQFGLRDFETRLFVVSLLIREFEIARVSGVVEFFGELGGGFVSLGDQLQPAEQLFARLQSVEGHLHVGGQLQDFAGDARFHLGELRGGEPFAQRNDEEVEEILRDRVFYVRPGRRAIRETKAGREARISEQPGLDQIGLGDPDFLKLRLERAVIQQRHLHRGASRELVAQERPGGLLDLGVFRTTAVPFHALASPARHRLADAVERCTRCAAASKQQCCRRKKKTTLHCFSPSTAGVFLINVIPQIGHWPGFFSWIWGCIWQVK